MKRLANITRLASGKYQVRLSHDGRNRKTTWDTLEQAKAYRDQVVLHNRLVAAGLPGLITRRPALLDLLRDWLAEAERRVADRTHETYSIELRPVETYVRDVLRRPAERAEDVDDRWVAGYQSWRLTRPLSKRARRLASKAQVRRSLKLLRTIYAWAKLTPAWRMPKLPRDNGGKRVPTREDLARLLAAVRVGSLERTAIELGLRTGIRPGDLYRLTWRDVDLAQGLISWRAGKTGQDLVVPISPELRRHLEAWRRAEGPRPIDGRMLHLEGRPLRAESLRRRLQAACKVAEISPPFVYLGWTRNVFVGLGLERAQAYLVARAVGHKDLATTMAYPRRLAATDALRGLVEAVDAALAE